MFKSIRSFEYFRQVFMFYAGILYPIKWNEIHDGFGRRKGIGYGKLWTAFVLIGIFISPRILAQTEQNVGNMTRMITGTGGGAAQGNTNRRELLPLVLSTSSGGTSTGNNRLQSYQIGVILARPHYINLISSQLVPNYLRASDNIGPTYNTGSAFQLGPKALSQPLSVDPDDMELKSQTWYTIGGINFDLPTIQSGLRYDTNSSNTPGSSEDPSIFQLTSLNIPFSYGTLPGSSAFLMQLTYQPTYQVALSGNGVNEMSHEIKYQLGKDLGLLAYAVLNETTLSSFPVRELQGRNRIFKNRTTLRTAFELAPKSLMLLEAAHSISNLSRPGDPRLSETRSKKIIIVDDVIATVNYLATPKVVLVPQLKLSRTLLSDSTIFAEDPKFQISYAPSSKLTLSIDGALNFRHSASQPTEISKYYGLSINYNLRPKTILELELNNEIRPSFADEGIFLREQVFALSIKQAMLLRWYLEFQADYILRSENVSNTSSGLEQRDFGLQFQIEYLLSNQTAINFGISRYQLNDILSNTINTRLNLELSFSHLF